MENNKRVYVNRRDIAAVDGSLNLNFKGNCNMESVLRKVKKSF